MQLEIAVDSRVILSRNTPGLKAMRTPLSSQRVRFNFESKESKKREQREEEGEEERERARSGCVERSPIFSTPARPTHILAPDPTHAQAMNDYGYPAGGGGKNKNYEPFR